jgi:hypothetical protein
MIYILTPHHYDFIRTCKDKGLDPMNVNNIKWIHGVEQFYGLKIYPEDQILVGDKYYDFPYETTERFKVEIELRKRI